MNKVVWSQKARKQLLKIARKEADIVYERIGELRKHPNCRNVKKLHGHLYGYRLRVGQYRVLFNYDGKIKIVSIEEVKKRDERTY